MNLENYDDAHLPSAAYSEKEWEKFYPFLIFVFKDDKNFLKRVVKYRQNFIK